MRSAASTGTSTVCILSCHTNTFIAAHEQANDDGSTGNWIAPTPIPDQTFESREVRLEGVDKKLLVAFARKVLCWLPEKRISAAELLDEGDDFLTQWDVPDAEEDDE